MMTESNLFCVVDVGERIGGEQDEIRSFVGLNCASVAQSEKFGRIAGCSIGETWPNRLDISELKLERQLDRARAADLVQGIKAPLWPPVPR